MSILTNNSLLTLSAVKSYLGVTSTDYDERYEDLINVVSMEFNRFTGRKLKNRVYSSTAETTEDYEYRDGNGTDGILLHQYPVTSSATDIDIYIDEDRSWSSTADQVESTDIIAYKDRGKLKLDDDSFDSGTYNVRIKYAAGYTVTSTSDGSTEGTLPADLGYAAKQMVRYLHNREKENLIGIRNISADGYSQGFETDMPWSVMKTLGNYRNRNYE